MTRSSSNYHTVFDLWDPVHTKSRSIANESQQSLAMRISLPTSSGIFVEMKFFTVSTTFFGTFVLALRSQGIDLEVSKCVSDSKFVGFGLVHLGERCRNLRVPWPSAYSENIPS